ncbi:MAG: SGNH/GDSL hydrolase family protein [Prevotellaceae bacterium]|nr:SGNH/GDSL hydrolase family protein [Candidatus Faecinaster equi]
MKTRTIFGAVIMIAFCNTGLAQTLKVYEPGGETSYNVNSIDSMKVVESEETSGNIPHSTVKMVDAHWCALGTSITYLNDYDKQGRFKRGYLDRTMDQIHFSKLTNQGVSGGTINSAYAKVIKADYYTIEHGINDWGNGVEPGTFEDYVNGTNQGSFAYWYRKVIDRIFQVNPKAKVVLCTPRKAYDFMTFLPPHCMDIHKGHYLKDMLILYVRLENMKVSQLLTFMQNVVVKETLTACQWIQLSIQMMKVIR